MRVMARLSWRRSPQASAGPTSSRGEMERERARCWGREERRRRGVEMRRRQRMGDEKERWERQEVRGGE
jgi:hypothetical protein